MTDLDLTRYEGHTEGPWNAQDHEDELLIFAPRHGRLGETLATLQVSDLPSSRFQKEQQQANARLIADAPLLLDEVRRLREELAQAREDHHKLGAWPSCPQCVKFYRDDEEASVQYDRLRRSHARLLKELYLQRERWVLLKQVQELNFGHNTGCNEALADAQARAEKAEQERDKLAEGYERRRQELDAQYAEIKKLQADLDAAHACLGRILGTVRGSNLGYEIEALLEKRRENRG